MKPDITKFAVNIRFNHHHPIRFTIESGRIIAERLILGFYPKLIWKFDPPSHVALSLSLFLPHEISSINKNLLNIVVQSVENCKNLKQLERMLELELRSKIQNYLTRHQDKFYSFEEIVELLNTPREFLDTISEYQAVLDKSHLRNNFLVSSSLLPKSKDHIENVLRESLQLTSSKRRRKELLDGLFWLNFFVGDRDIPPDKSMRAKLWADLIRNNQKLLAETKKYIQRNPGFVQDNLEYLKAIPRKQDISVAH
jgi:hypothetical protein